MVGTVISIHIQPLIQLSLTDTNTFSTLFWLSRQGVRSSGSVFVSLRVRSIDITTLRRHPGSQGKLGGLFDLECTKGCEVVGRRRGDFPPG